MNLLFFIFLFLLFVEIYVVADYFLFKSEKIYPIQAFFNLLFILIINSYFFHGRNIFFENLYIIYSCSYLLLTRFYNLKSIKFHYFNIIISFIASFIFLDLFILMYAILLTYLFYTKDIYFVFDKDNFDLIKRPEFITNLNFDEKKKLIMENKYNVSNIELIDKYSGDFKRYTNSLMLFLTNRAYFLADCECRTLLKKIADEELKKEILEAEKIELIYSFYAEDYLIRPQDFERNNEIDQYFNQKYKFKLLKIFENKCLISGSIERIELDHAIIPKSKGGNFILKHKNGYLLLNALPLTKSVNLEKSDTYGKDFFSKEEINYIFNKLKEINILINKDKELIKLYDGNH